MGDTVETIYTDDKQRRARIVYDDDGSSCDPRGEFDGELVDIVTGELRRWNVRTENAMFQDAFDRFNDEGRAGLFKRWLKVFHDTEAMPVFMMEHSSVALRTSSFNDPWDSGQIGWAYIRPDAEKWEGMDPAEIIKSFVETLGQWMNGEVYGYIVEKLLTYTTTYSDGTTVSGEEWVEEEEVGYVKSRTHGGYDAVTTGNSCWGYIGLEWAIQAAKTEGLGMKEESNE